jgi:hypothetical protein
MAPSSACLLLVAGAANVSAWAVAGAHVPVAPVARALGACRASANLLGTGLGRAALGGPRKVGGPPATRGGPGACTPLRAARRNPAGRGSAEDAALLEAAAEGDASAVRRAVEAGARTTATDDWGTTCLHLAVKGNHIEVFAPYLNMARAQSVLLAHFARDSRCRDAKKREPAARGGVRYTVLDAS